MGTNVSIYLSDEALAKLDTAVTKQAAEDQALGLSGRKVANRSSIIERLIRENLETQGALDRATITYFAIKLGEAYGAERISLFGSYARGEATAESDIDILLGGKALSVRLYRHRGTRRYRLSCLSAMLSAT